MYFWGASKITFSLIMAVSNTLKEYFKKVINDNQLDDYLPEIINSFSLLQLRKNDFFVKEEEVCRFFWIY